MQTHVDTVMMADRSGPSTHRFHTSLDQAATNRNHGVDGVNALYVDGHVEWVPQGRITERIPNRYGDHDAAAHPQTGVLRNQRQPRT
jgi:prepilin-type processing-associated H-X9-DG protein